MERNLQRMSEFWRRHLGVDVTALRGGGAAGGLVQRPSRALKRSLGDARPRATRSDARRCRFGDYGHLRARAPSTRRRCAEKCRTASRGWRRERASISNLCSASRVTDIARVDARCGGAAERERFARECRMSSMRSCKGVASDARKHWISATWKCDVVGIEASARCRIWRCSGAETVAMHMSCAFEDRSLPSMGSHIVLASRICISPRESLCEGVGLITRYR